MNHGAKWVSAAMYDKRDMQAVEFRALAGSFLWSTGANQYAGRYTLGHFDLPMRNCTIALDGRVVVRTAFCKESLPDDRTDPPCRDADERPADYYDMTRVRPEVAAAMRKDQRAWPGLCARAKAVDDEASFPTDNYRDLADNGFLGLSIPQEFGGWGFSMGEYAMVGAEIAKYCGATALTFNMHNSSMAWSRFMYDMPNLTRGTAAFAPLRAKQFTRAMKERAIFSQPISEGGQNWTSKPNQTQCRKVDGGWKINGFKKFASLAGYCDYYTIVCTEVFEGSEPRHEDTVLFVVHKDAPGLTVKGDWDPLGMRGTNSRDLILKDVFVTEDDLLMPNGIFGKTLPNWPHMMATLSPTYMGVAQGAYDFTLAYLQGPRSRPAADRPADVCDQAGGGVEDVCAAGEHAGAVVAGVFRGQGDALEGRGDADVCRAVQRDGGGAGDRRPGDPHLRRAVDAEVAAAGADVPRQPLRRADAALYL
jgi:alkylation response protein AidB-like acyl-CoA dehydrogenase